MVEKIWRSIDPEFFTDIEDLLEDTIQSVAPSFIVNINTSLLVLILNNFYSKELKYLILT
jgi:Ca2+-dependent lipid-binding protein